MSLQSNLFIVRTNKNVISIRDDKNTKNFFNRPAVFTNQGWVKHTWHVSPLNWMFFISNMFWSSEIQLVSLKNFLLIFIFPPLLKILNLTKLVFPYISIILVFKTYLSNVLKTNFIGKWQVFERYIGNA